MLNLTDLLHLSYTPDLTEGGLAFSCRSLACSYDRMRDSPYDSLRRQVADVAVGLAFRRHLNEQTVPFIVLEAAPFTHPDQYDLSLGGHRCILNNCLISRRSQISQLRADPGSLLLAPALLPLDRFAAEDRKPEDLYVFAFLLGLVAASQTDVEKAIAANQPVALIHLLPEKWAMQGNWIPLEEIALKSECVKPISVEIGGQDAERNFITTTMELPPRQRMLVEKVFHSLAYIRALSKPEARIGIHSPLNGEPYLIPPRAWSNLWIYGMDLLLTGWLTHEDFRRKSRVLNAGAYTIQDARTRMKTLLVPLVELNPLAGLFDKVRKWETAKDQPNFSSLPSTLTHRP